MRKRALLVASLAVAMVAGAGTAFAAKPNPLPKPPPPPPMVYPVGYGDCTGDADGTTCVKTDTVSTTPEVFVYVVCDQIGTPAYAVGTRTTSDASTSSTTTTTTWTYNKRKVLWSGPLTTVTSEPVSNPAVPVDTYSCPSGSPSNPDVYPYNDEGLTAVTAAVALLNTPPPPPPSSVDAGCYYSASLDASYYFTGILDVSDNARYYDQLGCTGVYIEDAWVRAASYGEAFVKCGVLGRAPQGTLPENGFAGPADVWICQ